jgi:DNA polymerase-3 subunit epsilon
MRLIAFDTETTGMTRERGRSVCAEHRVIELGCVELSELDQSPFFHSYLKPNRDVDPGAFAVHGLSNSFLNDKPTFDLVVENFISFIEGATLIAHNAPFDIEFINQELDFIGMKPLTYYCNTIIDTLPLARKIYPGKKNSLDALCQRLNIDLSGRAYHGALKDSYLLLMVYRKLIGGQSELNFISDHLSSTITNKKIDSAAQLSLPKISITDEELRAHHEFIKKYIKTY